MDDGAEEGWDEILEVHHHAWGTMTLGILKDHMTTGGQEKGFHFN